MKKLKLISAMLLVLSSNTSFADKAYFAGGCFWCMESDFEKLDGVSEVVSGFTGGALKNPTYNGNHKGHHEAVEVEYDPKIVSYQQLLDYFWVNIDPFDDRGQFCDKGSAYLSAIFPTNAEERKLAEASKIKVMKKFTGQKIVMPIIDKTEFYPIKGDEAYHQNYYKTHSTRYKFYRWSCGRDKRLKEVWGDLATVH